jgi:hypothetical protein
MKAAIQKSKRPLPKGKQIGLRSKQTGKTAADRLPFVGKDHGHHSSWDVPMTGGFHGGCAAGKAVAQMFLKYVRDERSNHCRLSSCLLGAMMTGLAGKQPTTTEEEEAVRGQRAGFIHELGNWIEAAAEQLGTSLDGVTELQLVDHANQALTRTDAALMAAIEKQETGK